MKHLIFVLAAASLLSAKSLDSACQIIPVDYQYTVPRFGIPEHALAGVSLRAALGEFECAAFVVHAQSPLKMVSVEVSEFVNSSTGRKIPGDSISVRYAEYAYIDSGKKEERPVFLRKMGPLPLKADENREFWITLRSGNVSDTGVFKGQVTVKGEGCLCVKEIAFEVLPFRLKRSGGPANSACIGLYPGISAAYMRDLRDHGINTLHFFWGRGFFLLSNVSGEPRVDFVNADPFFGNLKACGFKSVIVVLGNDAKGHFDRDICNAFPPLHLDTTQNANGKTKYAGPLNNPRFDSLYVDALGQLKSRVESFGLELMLHIYDEATERFTVENAYRAKIIRKAFPGLQLTGDVMEEGVTQGLREIMAASDILFDGGESLFVRAPLEQKSGKGIWMFNFLGADCEAGFVRARAGFYPLKFNPRGTDFWAYNFNMNDPYVQREAFFQDASATVIFPTAEGDSVSTPDPSIAWEGHREANDDKDYFLTLSTMLSKTQTPLGKKIAADLSALKEGWQRISGKNKHPDYSFPDVARSSCVKWILSLIRENPAKYRDMGILP